MKRPKEPGSNPDPNCSSYQAELDDMSDPNIFEALSEVNSANASSADEDGISNPISHAHSASHPSTSPVTTRPAKKSRHGSPCSGSHNDALQLLLSDMDDSDAPFPGFAPSASPLSPPGSPQLQMGSASAPSLHSHSPGSTADVCPDVNPLVFLVEPVPDHRPVTKFLSNDIKLAKGFTLSAFGQAGITRLAKNRRLNLAVISVNPNPIVPVSELLSVDKIGDWSVRCRLPRHQLVSYGVIGPFGEDTTGEDVTEALQDAGHGNAEATRIFRSNGKIKTSMFKIALEGNSLPDYVYVGFERYRVSTYVDKPWQCFRCQRFGHSAAHCTSPPRCVACGGAHSVKDCDTSNQVVKCANCNGNHTASYGGCSFMKDARKVEAVRATQKLSYRDAARVVKSSASKTSSSPTRPLSSSPLSPASRFPPALVPSCPLSACDVGTQTIDSAEKAPSSLISPEQLVVLLCKVLTVKDSLSPENSVAAITEIVASVLQTKVTPSSLALSSGVPAASSSSPPVASCSSPPAASCSSPPVASCSSPPAASCSSPPVASSSSLPVTSSSSRAGKSVVSSSSLSQGLSNRSTGPSNPPLTPGQRIPSTSGKSAFSPATFPSPSPVLGCRLRPAPSKPPSSVPLTGKARSRSNGRAGPY